MKISGILNASNDEPHYIHLNLEDFLKASDIEKNENILSRANLEKLNNINEKKNGFIRQASKRKPMKLIENLQPKDFNKKKITNVNNSRQGTLRSYKNEENEIPKVGLKKTLLPNQAYQPKKIKTTQDSVLRSRKLN